jgi:hypothetical protein
VEMLLRPDTWALTPLTERRQDVPPIEAIIEGNQVRREALS